MTDFEETVDVKFNQSARKMPVCVGCRDHILDRYLLKVAPDREWHTTCLKCNECGQQLDETCTCFVREEKTYCKRDYIRLYGTKCVRCELVLSETDIVMRCTVGVYHMDCFRCFQCSRQLLPGDEYSPTKDGRLLCKADFEGTEVVQNACAEQGPISNSSNSATEPTTFNNNNNNIDNKASVDSSTVVAAVRPNGGVTSTHTGQGRHGSRSHKSDQKTTRVRTVLNEKQLHTLRTCYAANPRPDALMKEQLVEMTGLNPRVIRVWFQNKRCKDKKRSILMKQMQQQHQEKGDVSDMEDLWICQKGVPMVATSPVRHEAPQNLQLASIEVHQYPAAPWKALTEFTLQSELDQQPFQQLISSFAESSGAEDDDDTVVSMDEPMSRSRTGHGQPSVRQGLQQSSHNHQHHHHRHPIHLHRPEHSVQHQFHLALGRSYVTTADGGQ